MKRIIKAATALLLAAMSLTLSVSARPADPSREGRSRRALFHDAEAFAQPGGWYCMRRGAGERPELPSEFSFIRDHECYYLGDDGKTVYLTFDAGYNNGNIERVLDALSAHSATGAFFIVSNLIKTQPELVERMAADGHLVCNHTMRHKDMRQLNEDEFKDELLSMEKLYSETTGHELAKFYRPPRGEFNENNLTWAESIGYKTVLWSLAYADWDNDNQPDVEKSLALLKSRVHPGAIILLHPTSASNAELLDAFLTYLESEGYSFGSLNDLSKTAKKKE